MKKIFLILGLLIFYFASIAQNPPFTSPRSSASITVQDSRLRALYNFYFPHLHGLTLNGGADTLGMVLYEDSSSHIWYRDTVLSGGHKWTMILKAGDAVSGVSSFNTRTGAVTLSSGDVVTALGYTPVNPNGTSFQYIAGDGSKVTFPTIPAQVVLTGTGLVSVTGTYPNININGITPTQQQVFSSGSTLTQNNFWVTGANVLGITGTAAFGLPTGSTSQRPSSPGVGYFRYNTDSSATETWNGSQWVKTGTGTGITGVTSFNTRTGTVTLTSGDVTGALGFTPYNASNPAGYISNITGKITNGANITITGSGTSGDPYVIIGTATGGSGCLNCNADSLKKYPVDTSLRRNGYALTFDSLNHKWVLAPNGSGTGITALTGDGTAAGSGSVAFTLATVNGNVGTFGSASNVAQVTLNGKGLATAASSIPIQIAESQVTNLVTDLAGKQSNITLTTTGTTGAATFVSNTLNIPQYQGQLTLTTTGNSGASTLIGNTINIPQYQGLLSNSGTGFRWFVPGSSIRSFVCAGCTLDSTSNAGSITLTVTAGGSGTVTSFSAGTLSPLFTTSVATATTTPALSFTLSNAAANTAYGNFTGSSAAPSFGKIPIAALATSTANTIIGFDGSGNPANVLIGSGLYDSAGVKIVWGEPLAQASAPARLTINSEVPMNNHSMSLLETTAPDTTQVIFNYPAISASDRSPIYIKQKKSGGIYEMWEPFNYGKRYPSFYKPDSLTAGRVMMCYASDASLDPGGMPDNVFQFFGYNTTRDFGQENTGDGSISFRAETHFIGSVGGVQADFEVHMPEFRRFDGTPFRAQSFYFNKKTGFNLQENFVDDLKLFQHQNYTDPYLEIQSTDSTNRATIININSNAQGNTQALKIVTDDGLGDQSTYSTFGTGDHFFLSSKTNTPSFGMTNPTGDIYLNQNATSVQSTGCTVIGNVQYNTVDPTAQLQVVSTTRGVLLPKLTTAQQNAISSPTTGLIIWNTDSSSLVDFNGAAWLKYSRGGGAGAVSSVSNSDGTLTISPTTGAVVASLALSHANTWTGVQTQPAPIFTSLTSSGANDSVLTVDPSTGQVHRRSGTFNLNVANGLHAPTVDSIVLGGNLNQNTNIGLNSKTLAITSSGANWTFQNGTNSFTYTSGTHSYTLSQDAGTGFQIGATTSAGVFSSGSAINIDTLNTVNLGSSQLSGSNSNSFYTALGSNPIVFAKYIATQGSYTSVTSVSTNTTANLSNHTILVDASGGAVTITLPAASTAFVGNFGWQCVVQKTDASGNTVTVQRAGSDLINGATTQTITTQYQAKTFQGISSSAWSMY